MVQLFILSTMSLTLASSAPSLPVSHSHTLSASPAITIIDAAPCRQRRASPSLSPSPSLSLAQRRALQDQMRAEKAKTSMFYSAISSLDVGRVERLLHEPNFCTTVVAKRAISLLEDLRSSAISTSHNLSLSTSPSSPSTILADDERINTILQLLSSATSRVAV